MGMYTGLRVKVIVKPEYRILARDIASGFLDWADFAPNLPFLETFTGLSRSDFIPNGALSCMPDSWETTDIIENTFDMETGLWTFQCSLKNYGGEIETFLKEVLPNLVSESIYVEVLYEEWELSNLYSLVDGEYVVTGGNDVDEIGKDFYHTI